jgi:hypothetical protein
MKKAFTALVVLLTFTIAYGNNTLAGFYIFSLSHSAEIFMPVLLPAQNLFSTGANSNDEANPRPDTNSSKYIPLAIGNTWLYEKFTGGGQYALIVSRITKDSTISGNHYFYCANFPSAHIVLSIYVQSGNGMSE